MHRGRDRSGKLETDALGLRGLLPVQGVESDPGHEGHGKIPAAVSTNRRRRSGVHLWIAEDALMPAPVCVLQITSAPARTASHEVIGVI